MQRVAGHYYCSLVPSTMGLSMWVCVCVHARMCVQVRALVLACLLKCGCERYRHPDFLLPRHLIQGDFPNPVLPTSLDTCPHVFHPETREISSFFLILSSHKSVWHERQAVRKDAAHQDSIWSVRGLVRNKQFGFRPKHSTELQLTHFIEGVCRKFGEKRLTGAVFLNVAKVIDCLLYKLSILNSLSTLLKPYLPTWIVRRLKRPSKQPPPLFVTWGWHSWGWNNFPPSEWHAFIFPPYWVGSLCRWHGHNSQVPSASIAWQIPVDISLWLSMVAKRMVITINISKSTAMLFVKACRCIPKPQPVQLFSEPIHWVKTAYLGVILATLLTLSMRWERKQHRDWECWDLSEGEVNSPSGMEFYCTSSSSIPRWTTRALSSGLPLAPISEICRCCSPNVFELLPVHLGTLVTGKFRRIWEILSLPTTSYLWDI